MISDQFALTVAAPVAVWLQAGPRRLRVHSAFTHAINLVSGDGRFLTLLSAEMDDGPFALRLAAHRLPEVVAGTVARVDERTLSVGSLRLDWRSAALWDPALAPLSRPVDCQLPLVSLLQDSDSVFVDALLALTPLTPLSQDWERGELNSPPLELGEGAYAFFHDGLLTRATHYLGTLRAGLQGDDTMLAEAARCLVGFGQGLTPAGDDLLLGVLAARRMVAEPAGVLEETIHSFQSRTTSLSAAFLRAACEGEFAGGWHRLRDALECRDMIAVEHAVGRILTYGATSGADALAGWLVGLEVG